MDSDTQSLEISIRESLQRALDLSSELNLEGDKKLELLGGILQAMQALPTQPEKS